MIDYKKIADAAAGKSAEQAFIDMSAETVLKYKTLTGNDLRMWSAMNPSDYEFLASDPATFSKLGVLLINSPDTHIDMGDPRVQGFVSALGISQAGKDYLFDMASYRAPVWPNLKKGHIVNALQKRLVGEV